MKTIHSYLLLVISFAIGLLAHAASAQTATWNAASGTWKTALNWNPQVDPNGNSFNVIFNNGGSLTLDGDRFVGTYSQTGGTFAITNGHTLQISSAGALDGGGVMSLTSIDALSGANTGSVVLTNSAGTLRGSGQIGYSNLSVLNQANGIIQADVSGQLLYLNGSGTFTNNGLMRAQGGGTLILDGSSSAVFNNNATIRSENGSNVSILFSKIVGGTLNNTGSTGTLTLNNGTLRDVTIAAGSTVTTGATRPGSLESTLVNHGTLAPNADQGIFIASNTTVSGGGVVVLASSNSVITNTGSNRTLTNTDNLLRGTGQIGYDSLSVINGAAGIIQADVSGQTLHLNGSGAFTNNGLMLASNGATLYFSGTGTVTNSGGTLRVSPTSTVKGDGGIIQTAGTIDLDSGNMNFPLGVDLNGGQLIGNGTFTGPIRNNGGIVGPGHSPGKITVPANYTQGANGALTMEIGGNAAGTEYDQLVVSGTATLGGTLNLNLINGFRPRVGDVFQLIAPSSVSGAFATINTVGFTGTVNYANGGITVTVATVPDIPLNISTRMQVRADPNQLIGGFIVTGSESKKVIILATGPSLAAFGIPGVLADPVLELYQGNTLIASNDNWKVPAQAEIQATGLQPSNDLESALVRTLAPGAYTAVVRGTNGTGVGTVQVYDLSPTSKSKLANISSRGFVEAADSGVMIAGFIIGGNGGADSRVVVRALGPSLSAFGIPGALADPTLELKNANGTTLISNDDWQQSPGAAEISSRGLAPGDIHESALVTSLPNGGYTAIVRGHNGGTGVGVVEVYNVE
jgi:hypothetical protein